MKKILFISLFLPVIAHAQPNRIIDLSLMQASPPTIVVGGAFAAFNSTFGSYTADQTIPFSSNHCTDSVKWHADAGMQVSKDGTNWDTVIAYPANGSGTVHNRGLSSRAAGSYIGNLTGTTVGGSAALVPYTAVVSAGASLSVSPTSLTLTDTLGSPGFSKNIVVTFSGTTVSVGAVTNLEYSKDGGSSYASTQSLSSGSPVTLKARIAATAAAGAVSGSIGFSGTGVTSQTVSVTGTVTALSTNDTIDVKPWDSIGHSSVAAGGKYTDAAVNFWAPVNGVTASLTSKNLIYRTGVQSPIYVTIDNLNDYTGNGSGYGSANTLGYPTNAYAVTMYGNSTTTITWHGLTAGTYSIDVLSAAAGGSGPYNQTFAVGGTTGSVNAYNNVNSLISLQSLSPSSGTLTMTITPSNSFVVPTYLRLVRHNP